MLVSPATVSALTKKSRGRERMRWGGRESSGARGFLQLKAEARGGNVGERGVRLGGFPTERERVGVGGWRKGMVLTGGPHPSATSKRERGKGRGRRLGRSPGREERGGGVGPKGREGKRGKGKFHFLFFFFNTFFHLHFPK